MVEMKIEKDKAVFEIQGWDKLWSLRSRLEIPLSNIKGAQVDPSPAMGWLQGFKLAGAAIPHVFRVGTFYQKGHLVFWDVHKPKQTIVIDLLHEHYLKLIIEVADPHAAVAMINGAVSGARA